MNNEKDEFELNFENGVMSDLKADKAKYPTLKYYRQAHNAYHNRHWNVLNWLYSGPLKSEDKRKVYDIMERLSDRKKRLPFDVHNSSNRREEDKFDFNNVLEEFKNYYYNEFQSDLLSYYNFKPTFGGKKIAFSLNCYRRCNPGKKLKNISPKRFCFFSLSVYFVSLYPQILGSLFGADVMEDCMVCTGFPWLNCGMAGLSHPINILSESELLPDDYYVELEDYLFVFSKVRKYAQDDFMDFFDGKHKNLDDKAYQRVKRVLDVQGNRRLVRDESFAHYGILRNYIIDPTKWPDCVKMRWNNAFDAGHQPVYEIQENELKDVFIDEHRVKYTNDKRKLIEARFIDQGRYEIPQGTEIIGNSAFAGTEITDIVIPDSVKKIEDNAFLGCDSLKSVTIPESVVTIGKNAFRNCISLTEAKVLSNGTTVGEDAFGNCPSLTSVVLSGSVISIKDKALKFTSKKD